MAARERRLVASSEAERITTAARAEVSQIHGGAGPRVDDAIEQLRRAAGAEADAAIEELEREAIERNRDQRRSSEDDPTYERAVAMVVAHVLGDADGDPELIADSGRTGVP
jgi:hypothetical protein